MDICKDTDTNIGKPTEGARGGHGDQQNSLPTPRQMESVLSQESQKNEFSFGHTIDEPQVDGACGGLDCPRQVRAPKPRQMERTLPPELGGQDTHINSTNAELLHGVVLGTDESSGGTKYKIVLLAALRAVAKKYRKILESKEYVAYYILCSDGMKVVIHPGTLSESDATRDLIDAGIHPNVLQVTTMDPKDVNLLDKLPLY